MHSDEHHQRHRVQRSQGRRLLHTHVQYLVYVLRSALSHNDQAVHRGELIGLALHDVEAPRVVLRVGDCVDEALLLVGGGGATDVP